MERMDWTAEKKADYRDKLIATLLRNQPGVEPEEFQWPWEPDED